MSIKLGVIVASIGVLGAASVYALKPGGQQQPDRYWQVAFESKFAKNRTVQYWRTHTAGETVEIYAACESGTKPQATAKAKPDGSWSLGGDYGNLDARIDAVGKLNLTLGGQKYGVGERISPVTCDKKTGLPLQISLLDVAPAEQTLAARAGTHLDAAKNSALPTTRSPAPPAPPVIPNTSKVLMPSGDTYKCGSQTAPLAEVRTLSEVPILGPIDALWPGALLQGKAFAQGSFAPVTIGRSGGTIVIKNVNFAGDAKSSAELKEMSQEEVANAIGKLMSQKVTSTEAQVDYRAEVVYNNDQLAYAMGVDGRFTYGLSNIIKLEPNPDKTNVLVRFRQTYYDVSYEDPESSTSVFRDGAIFRDEENQVSKDNPPVYVKSVGYGRMIFFLVTSSYEGDAVKAALQGARDGKTDGTAMSGGTAVSFSTILNGSTVAYSVRGGDAIESLGKMGTISGVSSMYDAIRNVISDEKVAQVTDVSKGLPVSYSLSYLATKAPASMGFATSYNYKTCSTLPKKYASFKMDITCIDDSANITVTGPDGKVESAFGGSGTPQSVDLDMFIAKENKAYTVRLTEYNIAGPSCLHFRVTRAMPDENGFRGYSYSGLDNSTGKMVDVTANLRNANVPEGSEPAAALDASPVIRTAGSWNVGTLVDYRIRLNRFTGEVTVTQGR